MGYIENLKQHYMAQGITDLTHDEISYAAMMDVLFRYFHNSEGSDLSETLNRDPRVILPIAPRVDKNFPSNCVPGEANYDFMAKALDWDSEWDRRQVYLVKRLFDSACKCNQVTEENAHQWLGVVLANGREDALHTFLKLDMPCNWNNLPRSIMDKLIWGEDKQTCEFLKVLDSRKIQLHGLLTNKPIFEKMVFSPDEEVTCTFLEILDNQGANLKNLMTHKRENGETLMDYFRSAKMTVVIFADYLIRQRAQMLKEQIHVCTHPLRPIPKQDTTKNKE